MIDIDKCRIEIKPYPKESYIKAFVSFVQDGIRLSGFLIKEGQYGFFLDAPKISRHYIYFDDNRERWKMFGQKAVEEYKKSINGTSVKEPQKDSNNFDNLNDVTF